MKESVSKKDRAPRAARRSGGARDVKAVAADQQAPKQGTPLHESSGLAQVLGDITWLMMQSGMHKHLFVADIEWLILTPLLHNQSRLYKSGSRPFAFVCWAYLDKDGEERLLSGNARLSPHDWHAGDRLWLVDVIAPFGGAEGVLANLKQTLFKDSKLMALRPDPEGKGMVACEVEANT